MIETASKPARKERKENAERRRRQLLDAARASILRHGLARTTLATVAEAAGLSQGVAAFYFRSKAGLLTAVLRDIYEGYERVWTEALAQAGPSSQDKLAALIAADFSAAACGPEVLPLWFAFWGELRSTEDYAEVAEEFDGRRAEALARLWSERMPRDEAQRMAEWMDTLTDGYWQRLHIAPGSLTRAEALAAAQMCLDRLLRPA